VNLNGTAKVHKVILKFGISFLFPSSMSYTPASSKRIAHNRTGLVWSLTVACEKLSNLVPHPLVLFNGIKKIHNSEFKIKEMKVNTLN
jgi:hypothetical protein